MRLALVALLVVACKHDTAAPPPPQKQEPPPKPYDPYAETRERMVTQTIEGRGVRDRRVLDAMREVPRDEFVPPQIRHRAYEDSPQQIGFGLTISQPFIVALMTEAAHVKPGSKVLEIGTGSGYQAAVLAAMGADVYTLEINEGLAKRTRAVLAKLGLDQIHMQIGDGYYGWPKEAPFDAIIVTAAPPHVPPPLVQQLKIGGRLVAPVGPEDNQWLNVITREPSGEHFDELIQVRFGPMIGEAQLRQ